MRITRSERAESCPFHEFSYEKVASGRASANQAKLKWAGCAAWFGFNDEFFPRSSILNDDSDCEVGLFCRSRKSLAMSRAVLSMFLFCWFAAHSEAESQQTDVSATIAQLVFKAASKETSSDVQALEDADKDQQASAEKMNVTRNIERLAKLQKPLSEIRLIASDPEGARPKNQAATLLDDQLESVIGGGDLSMTAPDRYTVPFCYRPLYFEELNLERCGNTYGCATNIVSAVHFLTNTAALPYRLATQRADCPIPTRGDCRTCQAFSHDIEPFGFEPKGALIEAAAIAGFVFLAM